MSLREALSEAIAKQKQVQTERDAELRTRYNGKPEPQSLEEAIQQTYPYLKSRNNKI
jgi:hypothetical protein